MEAKTQFTLPDDTSLTIVHTPAANLCYETPILIVHGYNEHTGRYDTLSQFFNQQGFNVWRYDLRGHGESGGVRGGIAELDSLVLDLQLVSDYVQTQAQQSPIIIGHSMGGLTSALAVVRGLIAPPLLILSSPALRLALPAELEQQLLQALEVAPHQPIPIGLPAEVIARDPEIVAKAKVDPLMHGQITPLTAYYLMTQGEEVIANTDRFTMPVLLLYSAHDQVVDAAGSVELAAKLPLPSQAIAYPEAYHEVFNEPPKERLAIYQTVLDFIKANLAED